jgi:DNA polymerase-3 subunit gamma/tau
MALALYRKYRPRTFAEIIGQEHVTEPLSQALRTGRLHHAYLFSGPRGCGKTSSARILARSLNCEKGPTPEPCGECDSCVALAPDGPGSIDVIEIDAASHGGVDDARDLRERAFFAPVASRYKVYVIDEAHMVSSAGFNALLKLVEEPPDYVKFVFATTEPEKVLGTIKSRTHHYPFRLIPPGVLRPYLEQLCAAESVAVEPPVFPLVVRAGGGSVRDALSVLDQLIAGAGAEGVTYARAVALLGVTDVALIDEMCDALAAGDGAAAYSTIDRVVEAGHDPRRFAGDLLERLRDLIVLQQVPDAAGKGLLGAAQDELERMGTEADRFGPATLSRMADIMHTGLTDMRGTTAPRLVLELLVARMLLPGADDSDGALLHRLERMERRLALSAADPSAASAGAASAPVDSGVRDAAAHPAAAPRPPATGTTAPPTTASKTSSSNSTTSSTAPSNTTDRSGAPGAIDAAGVRRIWDEVLTTVRRKSPRAAAVVREASVRDVDGDVLVLLFKHQFHAQALAAAPEVLLDAVHEVLGGVWQVRCEVSGQPNAVVAPDGGARTADPRASQALGDPRAGHAPADLAAAQTPADPRASHAPTGTRGGESDASTGPASSQSARSTGNQRASTDQTARSTADQRAPTDQSATPARRSATGAARSRGSDASKPSDASASGDSASADDDWPTPAPLGGAADDKASEPAASAVAVASRRTAAEGGSGSTVPAARGATGRRPASNGRTTRAGTTRPSTAGGATARRGGGDDTWAGSGDEEPPYDPEFDGPARRPGYEGFDPGDEPDDEADANAVRQTSEQQALDLLRQTLGAEKIDEVDTR